VAETTDFSLPRWAWEVLVEAKLDRALVAPCPRCARRDGTVRRPSLMQGASATGSQKFDDGWLGLYCPECARKDKADSHSAVRSLEAAIVLWNNVQASAWPSGLLHFFPRDEDTLESRLEELKYSARLAPPYGDTASPSLYEFDTVTLPAFLYHIVEMIVETMDTRKYHGVALSCAKPGPFDYADSHEPHLELSFSKEKSVAPNQAQEYSNATAREAIAEATQALSDFAQASARFEIEEEPEKVITMTTERRKAIDFAKAQLLGEPVGTVLEWAERNKLK
jgi:hypothetical protein